jgi:four helix bundle protein
MDTEKKSYKISDRAYTWSLQVIQLCKLFPKFPIAEVISRQLLRSATSVVANMIEGDSGLSRKDYIKCYGISLKECNESKLWLRYVADVQVLSKNQVDPVLLEAMELANIIASIIIKAKKSSL